MTKSIVTGGVMLVALAALVMGLTDVLTLSSAGIVSWAAVGAVATILFGAFGGFKPFFASGLPDDDEGGGGGGSGTGGDDGGGGSPLQALEGQSQSITRKLVTVGGEDEDGRPLFDDRAPIVSQPSVGSPPVFNPDAPTAVGSAQANHPLFGQALREQLDSDRVSGEDDVDHGSEALETSQTETAPEATGPPPLVNEAAPWVAARNAQIDEDASSVPTIDVEESPSWVTTADAEELDVEAEAERVHDEKEIGEPIDEPEETHDDLSAEAEGESESEPPIIDDASDNLDQRDTTEDLDLEDAVEDIDAEDSTEIAEDDASDSSSDDLVITSQDDQLPVVMKSPATMEIETYSSTEILAVVRAQESELVDTLIGEGVLTTSGPITDKDVRTMLFVAVSSNELIEVLTEASGDSHELQTSGRTALPKG
ncbi:MAG: hypothetical protein HKN03_05490 [Acidimicrobiales bacterium]|nr:hypothetical protein [Acidimicrobiales bacterium]